MTTDQDDTPSSAQSSFQDIFMNLALFLMRNAGTTAAVTGVAVACLGYATMATQSFQRTVHASKSQGSLGSETPYTATLSISVPLCDETPGGCIEPLLRADATPATTPHSVIVDLPRYKGPLPIQDRPVEHPIPGIGRITTQRVIERGRPVNQESSQIIDGVPANTIWKHQPLQQRITVTFTPSAEFAELDEIRFGMEFDVSAPEAWPSTADLSLAGVDSLARLGLEKQTIESRARPYVVSPRTDLPDHQFLVWDHTPTDISGEMLALLRDVRSDIVLLDPFGSGSTFAFAAHHIGAVCLVRGRGRLTQADGSTAESVLKIHSEIDIPTSGCSVGFEGVTPGTRLRFQLKDGGRFQSCDNQGHIALRHGTGRSPHTGPLVSGCGIHRATPVETFELEAASDACLLSVLPENSSPSTMTISELTPHTAALLGGFCVVPRRIRVEATFEPGTEGGSSIRALATALAQP